jgi:hypothetical protein
VKKSSFSRKIHKERKKNKSNDKSHKSSSNDSQNSNSHSLKNNSSSPPSSITAAAATTTTTTKESNYIKEIHDSDGFSVRLLLSIFITPPPKKNHVSHCQSPKIQFFLSMSIYY